MNTTSSDGLTVVTGVDMTSPTSRARRSASSRRCRQATLGEHANYRILVDNHHRTDVAIDHGPERLGDSGVESHMKHRDYS